MTVTLSDMTAKKKPELSAEEIAARELVRLAKEQGLSLTGPDGLLKQFTKNVVETALNEEMTEHLGHEKNRVAEGRESTNVRTGTRPKTVLTHATGEVELEVPRDREGTFEPVIVRKRQRRLGEVDEIVLSLYARGLTTGEISAHFDQIYGASVSKETISRITDRVIEEMQTWVASHSKKSTRRSSSMRSWSRSETAKSPTGRSTRPSGSPSAGRRTSWASGRVPVVRARSSG